MTLSLTTLLDRRPVIPAEGAVIEPIDGQAIPRPAFFKVNGVGPDSIAAGLAAPLAQKGPLGNRLRGIQSNPSALKPDGPDGSNASDTSDPEPFADTMSISICLIDLSTPGNTNGTPNRRPPSSAAIRELNEIR